MLLSFSVTNFKSFKDEVTLSMEATVDRRLHENNAAVFDGKTSINKVGAIYGANASGKTTLFHAMKLFSRFVCEPLEEDNVAPLEYTPFMFDETSRNIPTSMCMDLEIEDVRYTYGFSYDHDGILSESLFYYPNRRKVLVFQRDGCSYTFNTERQSRTSYSKKVHARSLYLPVSAELGDAVCLKVKEWFENKFRHIVDFNDDDRHNAVLSLVESMESDPGMREIVERAFRIADLGIVSVYKSDDDPDNQDLRSEFENIRAVHDHNGIQTELRICEESSGTVRFISIIGKIIDTLVNGGTVILDEMDMSIHTDLCTWVVELYLNPAENTKNAQMILNTHDVGIMDQDFLRRDQFWFTEKDWNTGVSTLCRLSDYGIRNDLDIRKAYLNGSFDSKPFIAPERLIDH